MNRNLHKIIARKFHCQTILNLITVLVPRKNYHINKIIGLKVFLVARMTSQQATQVFLALNLLIQKTKICKKLNSATILKILVASSCLRHISNKHPAVKRIIWATKWIKFSISEIRRIEFLKIIKLINQSKRSHVNFNWLNNQVALSGMKNMKKGNWKMKKHLFRYLNQDSSC